MYIKKEIRVKLNNHDCLPISMLLYIMLLAALSNGVCLYNAFLPMLFLGLLTHSILFQLLFCNMHSDFNLLVFPNSMFKPFFTTKGLCALWRNSIIIITIIVIIKTTETGAGGRGRCKLFA